MEEGKLMPVKKYERADWKGFAEVRLTLEQDADFETWDLTFDDVLTLIGDNVASGYKLSTAWNEQNETFIASLTGGKNSGGNNGYTLSSFASTWSEAIALLAYKHNVVTEGNWTSSVSAIRSKRG